MMQRTIIDKRIESWADLTRASAVINEKYGGEWRVNAFKIEPEYLRPTELQYECLMRGIFLPSDDERQRTGRVRELLRSEYKGELDTPMISPYGYDEDYKEIRASVEDVAVNLRRESLEEYNYNVALTVLGHLEARVGRLAAKTPEQIAQKLEVGNQVEFMIRRLVDYTTRQGARPKKKKDLIDWSLPGPNSVDQGTRSEGTGVETGQEEPRERRNTVSSSEANMADQGAVGGQLPQGAALPPPQTQPSRDSDPGNINIYQDIWKLIDQPNAQSTRWSNRDSMGTQNSAGSSRVHFNLTESQLVREREPVRRDTPYPGTEQDQRYRAIVGSPGDYFSANEHRNMAPEFRPRQADIQGNNYTQLGGFGNTQTLNRDNVVIASTQVGGRSGPVESGQSVTASSQFPPGFEYTLNNTVPVYNQPNIFGMFSPNQPTVTNTPTISDGIVGRNASVFGQFSRTKAIPVHLWKVTFSGEGRKMSDTDVSTNEFIYRVTVNKRMQGLSDADILSQIGFLLTHSASVWYLASQHRFTSWVSFIEAMRSTFLSPYHAIDAMDEISRRVQGKSETAKSYLYQMMLMFRALPFRVDEGAQTHIIVRNLLPEVQASVGPWRPTSLSQLEAILGAMQPRTVQLPKSESKPPFRRMYARRTNAVNEVENDDDEAVFEITEEELCALKREREVKKNKRVTVFSRGSSTAGENNNGVKTNGGLRVEELKCFNCQEMGHGFRRCPKDRVGKFCFRCGKTDVTTNECTDCPKNQANCLESEELQTGTDVINQ